ncbi:c-type cytochrome biogenesis protein CcmI [Shimia abyssi]|uniref:Cytochrome c-type biogenesis protein CcmH n=1 Tax=Shimia abyssi TaxID=1662395 RepID=A0A2P8FG82_9RHOB|nr:c-type cytochrome biogenesis protein CcmI [Shimia abyssi]PSL20719.1 cytochrome c-type biogenesis protein CcmH [Shimia abyssi]
MTLWSVITGISLVTGVWMAWPFLRARSMEMSGAEGAISIYRDQMDEIERDRRQGLINETEADAARQEVERRALFAARNLDSGLASSSRSWRGALSVVIVASACAVGLYAYLGKPNLPDAPLAERRTEALIKSANAGDINARIQILVNRTKANPDGFDDWLNLAQSYAAVGNHAASVEAFQVAVVLSDDRSDVLSGYAEAMTLANGNKVPGAARVIFEQVAQQTNDPRAAYYVALAKAQSQDFLGAIEGWAALAAASPPDAPWMGLVRRDIVNMARSLEVDVRAYLPAATAEEIAVADGQPAEGRATNKDTIASLERALMSEPKDYEGWIALAAARAEDGDAEAALRALTVGREHYALAPFVLQKFDDAERALGLDIVTHEPRGPDAEDMATAAELTQEERDAMIDGMVAGLAARLEDEPRDPDGWVMLIRSYATLGQEDQAAAALGQARETFKDNQNILAEMMSSLSDLAL